MNILLTGGTGFVGSHATVVMVEEGHQVILFDNLSNSKLDVVQRLEKITGKKIPFVEGDVRDTKLLEKTLGDFKVDAVIHFAGLKAVAESVMDPIKYFANNVQGSISLLQAMKVSNVKLIVFSSSATVYGEPQYLPYDEEHPTNPINPYGRTKLQVEQILSDLSESDPEWRVAILRYFNPVGAHESGLIGEDPKGIPNNLMPILNKVASGELPHLEIFGGDYSTEDGTAERDYIHVMDLVEGHLAALKYLKNHYGLQVFNLGAGLAISVLDLSQQFEAATTKKIAKKFGSRRIGDLPAYYANINKSATLLNWCVKRPIKEICASSWLWYRSRGLKM
jgi:UDP-glucose 4-epimerase